MATTTMGQTTPDVTTTQTSNKAIYWAVAAALAILLIFAFSTNRTDSVVTQGDQVNAPVTRPIDENPAAMEAAPAMDSTPTNSVIVAPENNSMVSPQTDTINNDGVVTDPTLMSPAPTGQDPGTSVSPDAPKGTVVR